MSPTRLRCVIFGMTLAGALLSCRTAAAQQSEPLPPGAVARLGSIRFRHTNLATFVAFSPDGKWLLSGTGQGSFTLWDRATGRPLHQFPGYIRVGLPCPFAAGFADAGKMVAVCDPDGRPHLWDVASGKDVRVLKGPKAPFYVTAFSPDGKTVLLWNGDQAFRLWDLATDREIRRLTAPAVPAPPLAFGASTVAFSPDGKLLAIGGTQAHGLGPALNVIRIWEVASGKELPRLNGPANGLVSLALSPDGKLLAASGSNQRVCLYDLGTSNLLRQIGRTTPYISAVVFSPDGKVLAIAAGSEVEFVDPATGKVVSRHRGANGHVGCVAYSPDGKTFALGALDNTIRLWDVATDKETDLGNGHRTAVGAVVYSSNGKLIATSAASGAIRLWDSTTGKELRRLVRPWPIKRGASAPLFPGAATLAFTKAGKVLAAAWPDGVVCLWDTVSGKELRRAKRGPLGSQVVAFSAEGDILADVRPDGRLRLSEVSTGRELLRMTFPHVMGQPGQPAGASTTAAIAFAPDSRTVVQVQQSGMGGVFTGGGGMMGGPVGFSTTIWLWETATGKFRGLVPFDQGTAGTVVWGSTAGGGTPLYITGMGGNTVRRLVFAPRGRQLLIVASNNARLWDLAGNREIRRFDASSALDTFAAAFSPDGKLLALAGQGEFSLWDTATGQEVARVGRRPGTAAQTLAPGVGQQGTITALVFSPDGKRLISGAADTTALVWDVAFLLREGQRRRADPSLKQLERLWTDLGGADAEKAYRAIWSLADAKKGAVPFLAERLRPAPRVDNKRIAQLVADLDSKRFGVRQRATKELDRLGEMAEPELKKVLDGAPGLELQRRVEQLLDKLAGPVTDPERLRALRAVEVLEQTSTPEARKVLAVLAGGAPQARLTREAQAALERLGRAGLR
jgi:WD40 repeat protein